MLDKKADPMTVIVVRNPALPVALLLALSGCTPGDGIDEDGTTFDEISPSETVTLIGTEPFWTIEIIAEGEGFSAVYSAPELSDGRAFTVDRFAGNNGLGLSGELMGRPLQATVTPGECSDGMSDRLYPFIATVSLGDEALFGCAYTDRRPYEERTDN